MNTCNIKYETPQGLICEDGVNWFVYVGNNPLRYVDPSGLRHVESDAIEERSHYDKETNTLRSGTRMDRFNDRKVSREDIKRQQEEVIPPVSI